VKCKTVDCIYFTDIAKIEFRRHQRLIWRSIGCPGMARYFLLEYMVHIMCPIIPEQIEEPLSCFDGYDFSNNNSLDVLLNQ
jgi:hypothetical protein